LGTLLTTWQAGRENIPIVFALVFLAIAVVVAVLGEQIEGGALEEIVR
jgi:hypothetical protein